MLGYPEVSYELGESWTDMLGQFVEFSEALASNGPLRFYGNAEP